MGLFEITTVVIVLTAVFSYLNSRYVKLPTTIGVMAIALGVSLLLLGVGKFWPAFGTYAAGLVQHIDFNKTLLHGMLAFLLFAGAQHIELDDLLREFTPIALLAIFGTVISMFLIAGLAWMAMRAGGVVLPFAWCLLFGALASPTDPVAVIGIMRQVGAPPVLETQIAGESLFNDGVGVALFSVLLTTVAGQTPPGALHVIAMAITQSLGGIAIGLLCGVLVNQMLQRIDNYKVELLLSIALAMGSYALADHLRLSGPIACVVAGLMIGNQERASAMSIASRQNFDIFWELLDEVFNAVLFVLIGMELLAIPTAERYLIAAVLCVPVALGARAASVAGMVSLIRIWRPMERGTIRVLTWGGLRGGLSMAMALAIPAGPFRGPIVVATYAIVVFSILVQGLTVKKLVQTIRHEGTMARRHEGEEKDTMAGRAKAIRGPEGADR